MDPKQRSCARPGLAQSGTLCSQTQAWKVAVSCKAVRGQGGDRGFKTRVTRRELRLLRWKFSQFAQLRLSYGRWELKRQVAKSGVGLEEK